MKENSFKKIFNNFILEHSDLIGRYENECNDIFEDNYEDIYTICFKSNNNKLTISVKNILYTALYNAISYRCSILDSLNELITITNDSDLSSSSINTYFNEVNNIYNKNGNNYDIVYCPENREKLILMNLKSVISVAKNYQNLGLDFDDLIQAGNEGLCVSFDKYDPSRARLKDKMLAKAETLNDKVTIEEINRELSEFLSYGDVMKKFKKDFDKKVYTKQEVIKWIKKNIYNAKFNSVANMWIKAYIINELNNNSRTVKKPKAEIDKDVLKTGTYSKEVKLNIDMPVGNDETRTLSEILYVDDDDKTDLDVSEAQQIFKEGLSKLLSGVKPRDRGVFLKKFGIGLPRPMLPNEIANQEGLSIARVSQIFQTVEQQIQKNQAKYNIDIEKLLEAAKVLR